MAKVELQWSGQRCRLRALLSQRHLPVIVRTVNGYNGLNGIDQLCTGQVGRLHCIHTQVLAWLHVRFDRSSTPVRLLSKVIKVTAVT